MNKNETDVEQTYSRLNGGGIGPLGILMVFFVFVGLCPVLLWEASKWFALMLWSKVPAKRHRDRAGLAKAALQNLAEERTR